MPFDPENFGFKKIDHSFQTIEFFELQQGEKTAEAPDYLRLNLYMSRDGDYVNIWFGLLEPIFAESRLEHFDPETMDVDFYTQYHNLCFKGCIETHDEAAVILKAIKSPSHCLQCLSSTPDAPLSCDML